MWPAMPRPSGSSPCVVVQGGADCSSASPTLSLLMQRQQPHEAADLCRMEPAEGTSSEPTAALAREGPHRSCKPPSGSNSSCSTGSSGNVAFGELPAAAHLASVKSEGPSPPDASILCAAARAVDETEGASAAEREGRGLGFASANESLRALQLLLSDVLGVLAMLRPAGSSALPRGVAAAVSRARQAALAALKERGSDGSHSSSSDGSDSPVASALAAAANTAAVVLEQRNPQFAFHQFTVLAAASLQELSPYVTHHLRELLQVLEQRRSLLRLLRSQERKERHGSSAAAATAEGQTDNLRLLLQVLLAYCPASMLDSVCDRLAAAYAQALLGETQCAQQKSQVAAALRDRLEADGFASGVEELGVGSQDVPAGAEGDAAADLTPRSLARPPGDAVAVSVASLLSQRSFLRRLASSMDWGAAGSGEASDGTASLGAAGSSALADESDVAAALRAAYDSAACLFDGHLLTAGEANRTASASEASSAFNAAAGSVKQQERPQLPDSRLPRSFESGGRNASYLVKGRQRQQGEDESYGNGRQVAADTAITKKGLGDAEESLFERVSDQLDSSSSRHLLRALGSLELPAFLLQQTSYSRSASPFTGAGCSTGDGPAGEAMIGAAEAADYQQDAASGALIKGLGSAAATRASFEAGRQTSWLSRPEADSIGSSRRRTLLQALAEVPEDYGLLTPPDKGARMAVQEKAEKSATAAAAALDTRYPAAEGKTAKGGDAGDGEEDAATKKATLVSFLLSLLPESGSYGAASDVQVGAAQPSTGGGRHEAASREDSESASKTFECTQALLNSLQGHLLRYGTEESGVDQQHQQHELGVAASGRRSRMGGQSFGARAGAYGKAELLGQHISGPGREGAAPAGMPVKHETLPHEEAGAPGRPSDADPSRAKGRGQQQHSLALRHPATASELGAEADLGGAGSVNGGYTSVADALGASEDDVLGSSSGGVNTQLLYRSTISGVVYDKSGQKWTARWSEYGRQHKKTFATAKYGFLHAKKRAEACRLEASRLMREGQGRALAAAARLAQVSGALQAEGGAAGTPSAMSVPSDTAAGSGSRPCAFSGLAVSAEGALQSKDAAADAEQPLPLLLQQEADPSISHQDSQLQQQRERETPNARAVTCLEASVAYGQAVSAAGCCRDSIGKGWRLMLLLQEQRGGSDAAATKLKATADAAKEQNLR
ncbi:hypothetical protein Efla_005900 [Eimeria flavescens]